MTSKNEFFSGWMRKILEIFAEEIQNSDTLEKMNYIFKEIIENGNIPQQLGESTDIFLNDFVLSLINKILQSNKSDYADLKPLTSVLISISYLFTKLIPTTYENFLQNAVNIFIDTNATIYESTKNEGELYSDLYLQVIKQISTPQFLTEIEAYLDKPFNISFAKFNFILSLISFARNIGAHHINTDDLLAHAIPCMLEKCSYADENLIENSSNYPIESIIKYLNELSNNDNQKNQILQAKLVLNVQFAASKFENKQKDGLKEIKQLLINTLADEVPNIISFIKKYELITKLTNSISCECLHEFFTVLEILVQYKEVTPQHYINLWKQTIEKDEKSIHIFFKNWCYLLRNQQENVVSDLFNAIIEVGIYNNQILNFLQIISTICPENAKQSVFRQVSDAYFEIEEINELYIDVIIDYLPSDPEFQNKMQNRCINMITREDKIDLAVPLLKATISKINSEKSHEILQKVTTVAHKNLLSLIEVLVDHLDDQINETEFSQIIDIIKKLANHYIDIISEFVINLFKNERKPMTEEQILGLLDTICHLEENSPTSSSINVLYNLLNQEKREEGIKMIWDVLFRNGSEGIANFMVTLFVNSQNNDSIPHFIEKCAEKIDSPGALMSLFKVIRLVEDGVDRFYNKFIPINKFIAEDEVIKIDIIYSTRFSVYIHKTLNFQAFKDRISSMIKVSNPAFSLLQRNRVVTPETYKPMEDNVFEVRIWYPTSYKPPLPAVFPSQVLMQEKFSSKLFDILTGEDENLGHLALSVLNLMPTLESQNDIIRKFTNSPKEWANFLTAKSKYLMLYRLNMIGSIIQGGHKDWINFFYQSGGVKVLLGIMIFVARKTFTKDDDLLLILRVSKIAIWQETFDKYKEEMYNSFDDNAIKTLIQFAIDYSDKNGFPENILTILSKFEIVTSKYDNFFELFGKTIFHKSELVRSIIKTITEKQTPQTQAKLLMPLLNESIKEKSDCYFSLLNKIAEVVDNAEPLWEPVIDMLFELFNPPHTESKLEKLKYEPADFIFAQNLFVILDKLKSKFTIIPNSRKLFVFIISEILFGGIKYYIPSKEVFNLIFAILDQNKDFGEPLLEKLRNTQEIVYNMPADLPELQLAGNVKHRGIFNPGKFDYISSVIQAIFGVDLFSAHFLSKLNASIKWIEELQYMFGELMFSPSTYIHPQRFLNLFRFEDKVEFDVKLHGDAFDFFNFFVDRLRMVDSKDMFNIKLKTYSNNEKMERNLNAINLDIIHYDDLESSLKSILGTNKAQNETTKIVKAPKILVFKLDRFVRKVDTNTTEKSNKVFTFPQNLDVSEFLDISLSKAEYELVSVINHTGPFINGHYTVYNKNDNKKWNFFDDQNYSEVDEEKFLFETIGGTENVEFFNTKTYQMQTLAFEKSKSAYLLFYRKKTQKKNHQIADEIISEVFRRIQENLFKSVSISTEFSKLVLEVSDYDPTGVFLYRNLITYTQSESLTEEGALSLVEKMISMITNSQSISEFVLSQAKDIDNSLIKSKNQTTRRVYSFIVSEAIVYASELKRSIFTETLANKIIKQSEMISECWANLDEFWAVIKHSVSLMDSNKKEVFFEAVLTFINTVLPMYQFSNPSENIMASIDAEVIFDILKLTISTNPEIKSQHAFNIFTRNFVETWIKPMNHTKSFISFIVEFIGNDTGYANMLKKVIIEAGQNMTAMLAASYITLGLFIDSSVCEIIISYVMKIVDSKDINYIRSVNEEVALRFSNCASIKNVSTTENAFRIFVPYLLLENMQIRNSAQELLLATLPVTVNDKNENISLKLVKIDELTKSEEVEKSDDEDGNELMDFDCEVIVDLGEKQQFAKAFSVMLLYLPNLIEHTKRICSYFGDLMYRRKEILTYFPARNYFNVLTKIVIKSGLKDLFIQSSDIFVEAIYQFGKEIYSPNYSLQSAFDFFVFCSKGNEKEIWDRCSSEKFFKAFAYFRDNFPSRTHLRSFLGLIIPSEVDKFINSPVFVDFIRDCMCEELWNFIVDNVNETNCNFICQILWSNDVEKMQMMTKMPLFFSLSAKILQKCPSTSDLFIDFYRIRFYIMHMLRFKSPSALLILDVLTSFNNAYVKFNKDKKNFFGQQKTSKLSKIYLYKIMFDIDEYLNFFVTCPENAIQTIYHFIISLLNISQEMRQKFLETLILNGMCLLRNCQPYAATLICNFYKIMLQASMNDLQMHGMTDQIAKEIQFAPDEEIIDEICSAYLISSMRDEYSYTDPRNVNKESYKSNKMLLIDSINKIMINAKSFKTFSGSLRILAVSVCEEAGKESVEKWIDRCISVCNEIAVKVVKKEDTNEDRHLYESVMDFATELSNSVGIEIPKLTAQKPKIEELFDDENRNPEKVENLDYYTRKYLLDLILKSL